MQFYGFLQVNFKLNVSSNVCLLSIYFAFIFGILRKLYIFKMFLLSCFELLDSWSHLSVQGVRLALIIQSVGVSTDKCICTISLKISTNVECF